MYPSLSTHFPVAIVDAWHAEIPVMATDNELLMGAGAQVPGRDQEAMTDAMLSLVTTPFLASGLVENGKRRREDYTWAKVAKRVAQVIRSPAL
ncbi:MAG: glycosyltransferase [Bacteroidota bacterium]